MEEQPPSRAQVVGDSCVARFSALDGLRGWLAGSVVLCHVIFMSKLHEHYKIAYILFRIGVDAVMVFVILSGFVITHLIITRKEHYRAYLRRRFFRIFPVYAACTVASALCAFFLLPVPGLVTMPDQSLALHAVAHATMLHGAIPNELLPQSGSMFLFPAWSLSLEWQFYLLAPAAVALARYEPWWLLALAVAASVIWASGLASSFEMHAFIIGASLYFLAGIASRLALPRLAMLVPMLPALLIIVLMAIRPTGLHFVFPFAVWAVMLAIMLADRESHSLLHKAAEVAFESRVAQWFGQRSYSLYLSHAIVLAIVQWGIEATGIPLSPVAHAAALAGFGLPLMILASAALYRFVELPGIAAARAGQT